MNKFAIVVIHYGPLKKIAFTVNALEYYFHITEDS